LNQTEILEKIVITIDRELIRKYNEQYFEEYPKRKKSFFMNNWKSKKKKPKELYSVLSLNDLLPINSMSYSNLKSQWGDLGVWVAKEHNLLNKNIENCIVEYRIFSENLAHKDCDNSIGGSKLLNDGLFVSSNMMTDDNYSHINPFIGGIEYDKEHPRLEIRITVINKDIKEIYSKMELHLKNFK
jgi:hypothetical protein